MSIVSIKSHPNQKFARAFRGIKPENKTPKCRPNNRGNSLEISIQEDMNKKWGRRILFFFLGAHLLRKSVVCNLDYDGRETCADDWYTDALFCTGMQHSSAFHSDAFYFANNVRVCVGISWFVFRSQVFFQFCFCSLVFLICKPEILT